MKYFYLTILLLTVFSTFSYAAEIKNNAYGGYGSDTGKNLKKPEKWFPPMARTPLNTEKTFSECPQNWKPTCTDHSGVPAGDATCKAELKELGQSQGKKLRTVHYEFSQKYKWAIQEDSTNLKTYDCNVQKIILLEQQDETTSVALSFIDINVMKDGMFSNGFELFNTPKGDILSIRYNVDGTGGGWENVYIYKTDKGWIPLNKDQTWDAMYAKIPAGYQLHKSPEIDFSNMHWDRAIATKEDGNCCPSGKISIDLDIVDDKLSVKNYSFETN